MPAYTKTTWVDDDGSGTVGTQVTAARMNNIEAGVQAAQTIIGPRASRPAGNAVPAGTRYLSNDTIGDWTSDGTTNWIRTNTPPGSIVMTISRVADLGYVMCDGASYLVSNPLYSEMIAAGSFGTSYDYGGVYGTSFLVPDFRNKMPRGRSVLSTPIVDNTTAPAITIASGNLPTHTHDMSHTHTLGTTYSGYITSDHYHNFTPPYGRYYITGYALVVSSGSNGYGVNAYDQLAGSTGGVSSNHQHDISHSHSISANTGNGGFANTPISIPQPQHLTVNFQIKL